MKMKIEIWNGCNNRFALVFCEDRIRKIRTQEIKDICSKFCTDGLILISKKKFINMHFFNPDGTKVNCGNGLRVTAAFCFKNKISDSNGIIKSLGMKFSFKISGNKVSILIKKVSNIY